MRIYDCQHLRTKCVHGATPKKVKWWQAAVLRGQQCLDCGALLERPNICTRALGYHTWDGVWTP